MSGNNGKQLTALILAAAALGGCGKLSGADFPGWQNSQKTACDGVEGVVRGFNVQQLKGEAKKTPDGIVYENVWGYKNPDKQVEYTDSTGRRQIRILRKGKLLVFVDEKKDNIPDEVKLGTPDAKGAMVWEELKPAEKLAPQYLGALSEAVHVTGKFETGKADYLKALQKAKPKKPEGPAADPKENESASKVKSFYEG